MSQRAGWGRSSSPPLLSVQNLCGVTCIFFASLAAIASQSGTANNRPLPSYDVVSIKPFQLTGPSFQMSIMNPLHRGRFQASSITTKLLLHMAFDVPEGNIEGGPSWIDSDLFFIDAKSDDATDALLSKMSDQQAERYKRLMLQQILRERFRLSVRAATREGTVTSLVLLDDGRKLRASSSPKSGTGELGASSFSVQVKGDTLSFKATSMRFLSDFLSQELQEKIVDKTDLKGLYNFDLTYQRGRPGSLDSQDDSQGPTLQEALQQIGVKIQESKGQVDSIVVVQITKPTEN